MINRKTAVRLFVLLMAVLSVMLFSTTAAAAPAENPSAETSVSENAEYSALASRRSEPNMGKVIGISLLVSVIVTGVAVFSVYNSYKNNGKTEPYPYNQKAPLELTDAEDIHVDTHVERRRIERRDN